MTGLVTAKQRSVRFIAAHPFVTTAALYATILLAVFNHVLRPGPARRWFGWDCLNDHWQDLVYPLHAFANGEWPGWNPFALLGEAFDGDPQTELFSPVNWLLWLIAAIAGDAGPLLIQVKVLLWMWIGLFGMHWFVHRQTRSHIAATLASLAYLLGSPNLTVKDSSGLWPLMALPWAALALCRQAKPPHCGLARNRYLVLRLCRQSPQLFLCSFGARCPVAKSHFGTAVKNANAHVGSITHGTHGRCDCHFAVTSVVPTHLDCYPTIRPRRTWPRICA